MTDDGAARDAGGAAGTARSGAGAASWAAAAHVLNGVAHVVIGVIILAAAVGVGTSTGEDGALRSVSALPVGAVAFGFVGLAMLALAADAVVLAVGKSRRAEPGTGRDAARAWGYATVSIAALSFATGGSAAEETAASLGAEMLLSWWGAGVLVAAGLVTLGVGSGMISRGITRAFLEDVADRQRNQRLFVGFGAAAYVAKGIAVAIVGTLLVVSVITRDPTNGAGLDGALSSLVAIPAGRFLVEVVGGGLIVYGIFFLVRSRAVPVGRGH